MPLVGGPKRSITVILDKMNALEKSNEPPMVNKQVDSCEPCDEESGDPRELMLKDFKRGLDSGNMKLAVKALQAFIDCGDDEYDLDC